MNSEQKFDVCLSFAGEDRKYVKQVAGELQRSGVSYFYDEHNQVELWGKNLLEHLTSIYRDQSLFAVLFISEHYAKKPWAVLERRAALETAMNEFDREYVLPARFDDTDLPGLLNTVSYLDLRALEPVAVADMIIKKLISEAKVRLPPEGFWGLDATGFHRKDRVDGRITITTVDESGNPVPNVSVFLLTERGTFKDAATGARGTASIDLPYRENQTVYCAVPGYYGHVEHAFDPVTDIDIQLAHLEHGGSIVFNGWGEIPGVGGRMIVQGSGFIASRNLSLNGKVQRLHPDTNGRFAPFEIQDADGKQALVRVLGHQPNNCALLQYVFKARL